jgi:hypothetical protein
MVLYANDFYLVYPSEKEVNFAKREYAQRIGKFNKDQIDTCMNQLAKLTISPERDNKIYREPNLPAIIALMEEVNKRDMAHKLFLPVPPESDEDKAARIKIALENIADIKNILEFDDE